MVSNLAKVVQTSGLPTGTATDLMASLQAALASLNRGDVTSANNQLGAFINKVMAQAGKKIPAALANSLISLAEEIINN